MPFIKFKPFALDAVPCYKCGRVIAKNDFNWSYNTRKSAMFSHRDCLLTEEQFNSQRESLPEPKPETLPEPFPTKIDALPTITHEDITERITLTSKHSQTSLIKLLLKLREYPFLYGAPGAGKTHLILSLASDMGLDCAVISCSADMFKSEILGSVSPVSGVYYSTSFRKCWEKGGVILFDEVGLAAAAFLNMLNAALAQKELRFPDGARIPMHSNTFILFADNSALYGNDPLFPERQDAGTAFRDRIAYVKFEYDLKLELQIITALFKGENSRASLWHSTVKALRSEIDRLQIPVFVSPRFAYAATKAFLAGMSYDQVIDIYLMRGLNGDIKALTSPTINRYRGNF